MLKRSAGQGGGGRGVNIAASRVVDAAYKVDIEEVSRAMNNMNNEKANGPSGVILEMVKIGEEPCLSSLTTVFNVLFAGKLPEEWVLSLLLLILKGKGDTSVRIRTGK